MTTPNKLHPSQATVDVAGQVFKHLVVNLRGAQSIAGVVEDPSCWSAIQFDLTKKLSRGDWVSLVAPDGGTISDHHRVKRAESGSVWLGAPHRLDKLEEVGLFELGNLRVTPNGTGYSIQNVRDLAIEGQIYGTVAAAKAEILKRQPKQVA